MLYQILINWNMIGFSNHILKQMVSTIQASIWSENLSVMFQHFRKTFFTLKHKEANTSALDRYYKINYFPIISCRKLLKPILSWLYFTSDILYVTVLQCWDNRVTSILNEEPVTPTHCLINARLPLCYELTHSHANIRMSPELSGNSHHTRSHHSPFPWLYS